MLVGGTQVNQPRRTRLHVGEMQTRRQRGAEKAARSVTAALSVSGIELLDYPAEVALPRNESSDSMTLFQHDTSPSPTGNALVGGIDSDSPTPLRLPRSLAGTMRVQGETPDGIESGTAFLRMDSTGCIYLQPN